MNLLPGERSCTNDYQELRSYPDEPLWQAGHFGHGAAGEGDGRHRSQTEEHLDLTGQFGQLGERYECWEIRDSARVMSTETKPIA